MLSKSVLIGLVVLKNNGTIREQKSLHWGYERQFSSCVFFRAVTCMGITQSWSGFSLTSYGHFGFSEVGNTVTFLCLCSCQVTYPYFWTAMWYYGGRWWSTCLCLVILTLFCNVLHVIRMEELWKCSQTCGWVLSWQVKSRWIYYSLVSTGQNQWSFWANACRKKVGKQILCWVAFFFIVVTA